MAHEVLTLGQVRIHSGSATREEAMKEAADILEAAGAVTNAYFDAMQQREMTVSTYMGMELAIPHGIAGKGDEHLEILSQIAILFSDEDEVAKLKAAQTPEELFGLVSAAGVS